MKSIIIIFIYLIPSVVFSQAMPSNGIVLSSGINNDSGAVFNGYFFAILLIFFLLPYIIAIIIFAKKKKYNAIKLFCGLTVFWLLLSVIFTIIIYLITGGSINTKGGIKSSLELSIIIGFLIGWLIALLGTLSIIEKIGVEGTGSLAMDIINNGEQVLIVRLFQALIVLLFSLPIKLIYKLAKV